MRVGIIGTVDLARTLAYRLRNVGHNVAVADLHDDEAAMELAGASEARAASVEEVVPWADVVFLVIPFSDVPLLATTAFRGTIVVDTTDYFPGSDPEPGRDDVPAAAQVDGDPASSSEALARFLPDARVVKSLGSINLFALGASGPLADDIEPLAVPIAGDDAEAKAVVAELLVDLGFLPIDAGSIGESWRMEPGTPVYGLLGGAEEIRSALAAARRPD